ncbi:MAG: hypothetical protein ACOX60_07395 [Massiliimalia sp.]|jgi:hypothetical protein
MKEIREVIMAKQSLLTLSAMQTIAGKAIRDLKNGGKRETRNVIELCRSFTKCPHQHDFWDMVKSFTAFTGSKYDPLLHRVAASVREDSLKTLAINLGCTAFAGGVDRIRSNHAKGIDHWWLQRFHSSSLNQQDISMWNERGIYVFLIDLKREADFSKRFFSLAAHNVRSTFVLLIQNDQPDFNWITQAAQYDNVCFLSAPSVLDNIGNLLVENRALFGVLRNYLDIEDIQTEKQRISQWIELGCVIIAYDLLQDAPHMEQVESYYEELVSVRKKGSVEIFLCDLQRDVLLVQEMLLGQRPFPEYNASIV